MLEPIKHIKKAAETQLQNLPLGVNDWQITQVMLQQISFLECQAIDLRDGGDLSKINSIKLDVTAGNFFVSIKQVLFMLQPQIAEKSIDVTSYVDQKAQMTFYRYDQGRFTQVLLSLVSNAIKFSREFQTVAVECHVVEEEAKEATIEVIVKDAGIGISAEN